MAWFKMDDQLYGHKKTRRAGVEAMGLWAICGAWSAAHGEDGFVPDYVAAGFSGKSGQYAVRLVRAGFWSEATKDGDTGWQFHDWSEYQPTAEQQQSKRDQWRERQRAARSRRHESPDSHADVTRDTPETHGESHAPVHESRPVPSRPIELVEDEPREDVEALCQEMHLRLVANGRKNVTITKGWRTDARLLLDRDERPLDEALKLIRWCQQDTFWRGNIGGIPKFREQYDALRLKSGIGAPGAEGPTPAQQMGWC